MKCKALILFVVALVTMVGVTPTYSGENLGQISQALTSSEWVTGNGQSCAQVCQQVNEIAVYSGIYKNGNPFYICRTNAHQEGQRAGYNLLPDWASGCWVGWGGSEELSVPYDCLCSK